MKTKKETLFSYGLMALTALAVAFSTWAVKGNFWQTLPLYVSLYVYLLQTRASRSAYLVGSVNSLFYAAVYFVWGLYSSASSALLISFPMQLFTFIAWSRKPYQNSTVFKKLSLKGRMAAIGGVLLLWGVLTAVFTRLGANQPILDNFLTTIGLFSSFLTLLQFVDGAYFTVASGLGGMALYSAMVFQDRGVIPYLVFSFYIVICTIKAAIKMNQLYKEQKDL